MRNIALCIAAVVLASQGTLATGILPAQSVNVRDHGAVGDGRSCDTEAINRAIAACSQAGGGQVRFSPGRYLSGTLFLRSNVHLHFDTGARLIGTPHLDSYSSYSGGSKWNRALIVGEDVNDVTISGLGTIDGNKVFDPTGEEKMRGPHTVMLKNCANVTFRDIGMTDSANYAIMLRQCRNIDVHNVKITGGWDGVHFRGTKEDPCRNIQITGCRFFTGDDSIAGWRVVDLLISDCIINTSCNGIRIIGPAEHMTVHDCIFYGPGLHPHRTQDRHNMLAGIILQPGAWEPAEGPLADVLISGVTMKNVASPVTLYLTQKGNTAKQIVIERLSATGVYQAAASVESWIDQAVENVIFRDVSIQYTGGGTTEQSTDPVRKPGVGTRSLPAWGIYARNVKGLRLEDVRLSTYRNDNRHVLSCEDVDGLIVDTVRHDTSPAQNLSFKFDRVSNIEIRNPPSAKEPQSRP